MTGLHRHITYIVLTDKPIVLRAVTLSTVGFFIPMAGRKSLSKKIRFEVFKRDKFTCQYCGRKAPDVVLEVDHINPVSKGGKNDLLNLVTSCMDCNRGKGAKTLSDDSVVEKQRAQIEVLSERREQLEMLAEWKKAEETLDNTGLDLIVDVFRDNTSWLPNDYGTDRLKKMIKQFGFELVLDSTYIAINKYYDGTIESWQNAFNKIGGICYTTKNREDTPQYYYKNYINKVGKSRFSYYNSDKAGNFILRYITDEEKFKLIKNIVFGTRNWSEFCNELYSEFGDRP